ncbi:MAG: hypothetical protein JNM39_01065 [Bdellovibrionaceae bacterium]|nr:hypothetical protein [Pseudobdellovibrionaceae bacterium]
MMELTIAQLILLNALQQSGAIVNERSFVNIYSPSTSARIVMMLAQPFRRDDLSKILAVSPSNLSDDQAKFVEDTIESSKNKILLGHGTWD